MDRIQGAMDLTDKLRIQNVENKQHLTNLNNQVKALVRRLDKMSRGGFEVPDAPLHPVKSSADDLDFLLGAEISAPSTSNEDDDLEKEFGPLDTPEDEIVDDVSDHPPQPTSEPPEPQIESVPEPQPIPQPPEPKKPEVPPTTMQGGAAEMELSPLPSKPVPSAKPSEASSSPAAKKDELDLLSPLPNKPAAPKEQKVLIGGDGLSGWKYISEPSNAQDVLNNLMVQIENAEMQSDVGNLITKAKDAISQYEPFSKIFFDMLMVAGKYQYKKQTANEDLVIKTCFEKIKEWKNSL